MATMTKKRKYTPVNRVTPGACVMCAALLLKASPVRESRTEVYAKKGRVRYCRCLNCLHTWKLIPDDEAA